MKTLERLIACTEVKSIIGNVNSEVSDITADSREVKKGSLFICLEGVHVDGHDYATVAADRGASVIIASKEINVSDLITVVYVEDPRKAMEDITPYFFDYPSKKMRMIAVTGTNGKTTTTHIIAHILRQQGYKVGVIGTLHWLINEEAYPIRNTTPDVITLQKILYRMEKAGVTHVSMEVSSHALSLNRIAGCEFDTAIFTNLTQDHLDYHKTMESYAETKARLFSLVSADKHSKPLKSGIINIDDSYATIMKSFVNKKTFCPVFTYGIENEADLQAINIKFSRQALSFDLKMDDITYSVHTKLVGRFNVYNTLAAIGAALSEGIRIDQIISALSTFTTVPGRFEIVDEGQPFTVIVDYAHTPDGLENILKTTREFTKGRIITVFGCGGDRDRKKRPIMGEIAALYSDIIIITSDNPRSEEPAFIISEIEDGVRKAINNGYVFSYEVLIDRRDAISHAIQIGKSGDTILIAGKGHETYQIIKDKIIHFDDREEARNIIRKCR